MHISTTRSPEVENFKIKIYDPAGNRIADPLNQRQTCYHLSQSGAPKYKCRLIDLYYLMYGSEHIIRIINTCSSFCLCWCSRGPLQVHSLTPSWELLLYINGEKLMIFCEEHNCNPRGTNVPTWKCVSFPINKIFFTTGAKLCILFIFIELAALAQMVACLPLVQRVRGF